MAGSYEIAVPDGAAYQRSAELARMVRELDKVDRDIEAAAWRRARKENPRLARLLWRKRKNAMQTAIETFFNTPTCTEGGLANLLA